jgi:hypothetical protein
MALGKDGVFGGGDDFKCNNGTKSYCGGCEAIIGYARLRVESEVIDGNPE